MRKVIYILFILLFFLYPISSFTKEKKDAKNKEVKISTLIKKANTTISKTPGGAAGVENELMEALKRETLTNVERANIYYTVARLEECQNGTVNRTAYVKKAGYDTAQFFNPLLKMYEFLERCDSFDLLPNEQGRIRSKFSAKCRSLRSKHHLNLLNGGKFYLSKQDYAAAYPFFDFYYRYADAKSQQMDKVVSWAALCGYMCKNPEMTLKYIEPAILSADTVRRPILIEYKAKSYLQLNNQQKWVETLIEGMKQFPDYDFFFVNCEDYYFHSGKYAEGKLMADTLLRLNDKPIYWFAKSRMELAENNFHKCIEFADSTTRRDPNFADAYYNKGVAYLNLALIAQETACQDLYSPQCIEERRSIQGFYQMAKPCMEMVRKLEPDNPLRWATSLYRIYLNLNMGEEFDEIDALLKSIQKEAQNPPKQ